MYKMDCCDVIMYSLVMLLYSGVCVFSPPHLITAAPQFNPAPNPEIAIISPFFTFPDLTASASANGIDPLYEQMSTN